MKKIFYIFLILCSISVSEAQWTPVFQTQRQAIITVSSSPDNSAFWFITNFDTLYKTSNGGTSSDIVAHPAFIPSGLFVLNMDIAFKTSAAHVWKTTNGGSNWDSTSLYLPAATGTEAGWNNAMFCYQNRIWIGTNNSRVYYSSNGGTSWAVQSTGSELNSYAIWLFGGNGYSDGLAGGSTLLITSNGGSNWNTQTSPGTGNFGGFTGSYAPVDNTLQISWYVRSDNKIYSSLFGANWQLEHTAPAGTYRYITGGPFGGPFWAVRNNGGISYHSMISGIKHVGSEIPKSFSLSQNYPNPFNPETKIKFQIAKSSFTKLVIYDELGREIESLVNEQLNAGTYEVNFDGSKFSSGIYFYVMKTDGFTDAKKMILVK